MKQETILIFIIIGLLLGIHFNIFAALNLRPKSVDSFSNYFGSISKRGDGSYSRDLTKLRIGNDLDDDRIYRAWIDFDTSDVDLPSDATITKISLVFNSGENTKTPASEEQYRAMSVSGYSLRDNKQELYDTIGSGEVYARLTGSERAFIGDNYMEVILGGNVIEDFKSTYPSGTFSIGITDSGDGTRDSRMFTSGLYLTVFYDTEPTTNGNGDTTPPTTNGNGDTTTPPTTNGNGTDEESFFEKYKLYIIIGGIFLSLLLFRKK